MGPFVAKAMKGFVPRKENVMAEAKKKEVEKKKVAPKKVSKVIAKPAKAAKAVKKAPEKAKVSQPTEKPDTAPAEVVVIEEKTTTATTAKAGKRSEKALKEEEAKQAKEERKAQANSTPSESTKPAQKPARPKHERKGKNYQKVYALIDHTKQYALKEAIELAISTSPVKFDAAVELHVNLGVDPKHADQNVRGNLVLPNGTGKTLRVAVLADVDEAAKAKKAGADIAGSDDLLAELEKGVISFDTLISTPMMMAKLGKYARLLGPKGLMPNPKSGTVTKDVVKAVQEAKAGKLEFRVDSTGIVHLACGKVSFGSDKLEQNAKAVLTSIKSAKPASLKSVYIKAIHITTSMGPSIALNPSEA